MTATINKPVVNLFSAGTKVKEPAKKVADKNVIKYPMLDDKIKVFLELKQTIDAATGKLKMIEGDIKDVGRKLFLREYLTKKCTPENFKIEDNTGATCMFICTDKYTVVDEIKSEILGMHEGLLNETTDFKFNADLVEKYGSVLSELIMNSDEIADEDKPNLITGEKSFSVAKGSIDRLMQYEDMGEIFELINPICSLKK